MLRTKEHATWHRERGREGERERVLDFLPLAKLRRLSLRKSRGEEADGYREAESVRLGEWITWERWRQWRRRIYLYENARLRQIAMARDSSSSSFQLLFSRWGFRFFPKGLVACLGKIVAGGLYCCFHTYSTHLIGQCGRDAVEETKT